MPNINFSQDASYLNATYVSKRFRKILITACPYLPRNFRFNLRKIQNLKRSDKFDIFMQACEAKARIKREIEVAKALLPPPCMLLTFLYGDLSGAVPLEILVKQNLCRDLDLVAQRAFASFLQKF